MYWWARITYSCDLNPLFFAWPGEVQKTWYQVLPESKNRVSAPSGSSAQVSSYGAGPFSEWVFQ
jgi:hypothetical protein